MKILLILGMSVTLFAQTEVTSPLTVLAPNDDSAPSVVQVQDQAQHTIGFIAPPLVTQIVVSSCTAANPTVCTLANPRPTTIQSGGTATLSGALGAGCSGLNATHAVSAVATSTITLTFNATGCTYTANSATLTTSIYWELPAKDCGAGEVWGYSAPYVIGCVTGGSGGANIQLSNLGVTAINASLFLDADDTYVIGADNERLNTLYTYRVSGEGPSGGFTTSSDSYVNTRKLNFFDKDGLSNVLGMDIMVSNNLAGVNGMGIRDAIGTTVAYFQAAAGGLINRQISFKGDTFPIDDNTWDLGSSARLWKKIWGVDARLTGLGGSGTRCVQVDNNGDFAVAASACGGSGANIQLSNLGTTAINANLLFDTNDAYIVGSDTERANTLYTYRLSGEGPSGGFTTSADSYVNTRKLNFFDKDGLSNLLGADIMVSNNLAGVNGMGFRDALGVTMAYFQAAAGGSVNRQISFKGDTFPIDNNTWDLGSSSNLWKKAWAVDARLTSLGGSGTRCLQADNNGDISIFGSGCSGGMSNPMTTTYDMIYSSSGSTPARLANPTIGGNYFLTSTAVGGPTWVNLLASSPISYSAGVFSCSTCVVTTRTISTTAPLAGGGDLSANRTLTIADAVADSSTKGAASFTTNDFNSSSGNISLDYTNGQAASAGAKGFLTSTDWSTFNSKMGNVLTTTGDMIYSSSGSTPARLPISGLGGTNILIQQGAGAPGWQNMLFVAPISYASGILSCTTCLTTASTSSMGGAYTITGNFYIRSFAGSGISCSSPAVADGWMGWDTAGQNLIMCAGGARYRVNLAAY